MGFWTLSRTCPLRVSAQPAGALPGLTRPGLLPDDALRTVHPIIRQPEEAPLITTRTVWFNGKLLPEADLVIPFRDRSFKRGGS